MTNALQTSPISSVSSTAFTWTVEDISEQGITIVFNKQAYKIASELRTSTSALPLQLTHAEKQVSGYVLTWALNDNEILSQTWSFEEQDGFLAAQFNNVVTGNQAEEGVIVQSFAYAPEREPYFMIPGSLYGTNNIKNSKSIQPQLNYRGDPNYPKTPVLYTRADRSTHNAVLSIHDEQIIAIRIDEASSGQSRVYNGLGVDTRGHNRKDKIAFTIGYHHFPVQYRGKLYDESRSESDVLCEAPLKSEGQWTSSGQLYLAPAQNLFAYQGALVHFYDSIHQFPGNTEPRDKAIRDLTEALLENCYDWEHHYFPTVLSGTAADTGTSGDMAWTGGMQVAYPLAVASKHIGEAKKLPIDFIDNLIAHGINKQANLFYEGKDGPNWKVCGWWQNDIEVYDDAMRRLPEAHSAYINGQATCYLLKTYQIAKEDEWPVDNLEQWFDTAKSIIDGVVDQQREDGAYGGYFDPKDGKAVYYNSFQGSWFLAGVAELAKLTGDEKYVESFYKAEAFYWQFHEKVELWGMPIDTRDAVDEEGNLAYVTALVAMHKYNQDSSLMEKLVHALHYDFTWKFAYNTTFTNEPLKSLGWPSSGGCITSSHNIHIHQMGNLIAEEMYYVFLQTGDKHIKSRLKDTLNWGLGTHNPSDNYFGFGKRGWATEQFFHSDGRQDDPKRIEDGGIWYDYLSWAAACTLLSTAVEIEDDYYYE